MYIKILIIIILILYLKPAREGFALEPTELDNRKKELYYHKDLFTPGVTYSKIKSKLPWIDSVVFEDAYQLALSDKLSISNLEKIIS